MVATQLIVVQAEANDKSIGDFKTAIRDFNITLEGFRLEQKRGKLHTRWSQLMQQRDKLREGVARVYDVLNENDVLPLQVEGLVAVDLELARTCHSHVGFGLHKSYFTRSWKSLDQLRAKHKCALQDHKKGRASVLVGLTDGSCQLFNPIVDLGFGQVEVKGLIVDSYFVQISSLFVQRAKKYLFSRMA